MTKSYQNGQEPAVSTRKSTIQPALLRLLLDIFTIRPIPALIPIPIKSRRNQRGNVFAMLFAAVALTGVLASVGMQTLTGPVTTITRVTQKNIAETNLLMNAKIIANAVPLGPNNGDPDNDTIKEAAPFVPASGGETAPANGGFLPTTLGLALTDPWGGKYGYCVWDHGSSTNGANYIAGDNTNPTQISTQPLIAVISAGPDKTFQTSCPTWAGGTSIMNATKAGGSDDLIQEFSYDGASAAANGLWTLDSPGGAVAQLKDASNAVNVSIDRSTGIGDFVGVTTDTIAAKSDYVTMDGGLKLDSEVNVTACGATNGGTMRFNVSTKKLELCDGISAWVPVGSDLWKTDGTHIWRETGNVGINTPTPSATLDVGGTLKASGATTLASTLGVTGVTTLAAALNVAGATALATTLDVTGAADFANTLDVAGDFKVNANKFTVNATTGNTDVGGTLNVTDATTLNDTLDVTGNTDLSGTLDVTGATALNSTLDVSGNTDLSGTLDVSGAVNMLSTLNVVGNAAIDGSTLFVDATNNHVGIGTLTPSAALEVAGGIKISVHTACAAGGGDNGTIQYDNSIKKMQVCVDGSWQNVSSIDKLDDIGDVYIEEAGTPNNNDILAWNASDERWEAKNVNMVGPAQVSPAGADGSIQFKNGSDLAADAANLHWDDTNNRLGIGTNTPSAVLTVRGSTGGALMEMRNSLASGYSGAELQKADGNWGAFFGYQESTDHMRYHVNTGSHRFMTNGVERLRIEQSGNVGIGVSAPVSMLDVAGGIKLGDQTTCAAGGANNGTLRYSAEQIQMCLNGLWTAVGGGGNGIAGTAPDAINCGISGTKRLLYLQTTTGAEYRYGFIAGANGIGMLVTYNVSDGSHVSTVNTAGWSDASGCDGKNFAQLSAESRSFYLLGGEGATGFVTEAAGAANEVQFRNSSTGDFSADAAFVYDDSNNRLGLGTATPTNTLQVQTAGTPTMVLRNTSGNATFFALQNPTPTNLLELSTDAGATARIASYSSLTLRTSTAGAPMYFQTANTTRMLIDGTGGVVVGSGASDASAVFQIDNSSRGFLPPRMSDPTTAIASPAEGLLAYNTSTHKLMLRNDSSWIALGSIEDGDKGDITVSSNGTNWQIDASAVGSSEIADGAVDTIDIANSAVTSLKIADGGVDTADLANDAVNSAKIADTSIATADLADKAITFAKIQDISTNRLLGRVTSGTGAVEEITIGAGLTISGTTLSVAGGSVGDVIGAASSTDNAIARYDGTTGKIIQNSAVTIGDLGETTITSASANALAVGLNGATNPVLQVDASSAGQQSGISIKGGGAATGPIISVISSEADQNLVFGQKGTGGRISFRTNGVGGTNNRFDIYHTRFDFSPAAATAAAAVGSPRFLYTGAADTAMTASTEAANIYFNLGQLRQHDTGALSLQRDFRLTPSTHSFVAASTLTRAAGLSVDGAPSAGTNATITTSTAIDVPTKVLTTGVTSGYGLTVAAPSGATNNYAAHFDGRVSIGSNAAPSNQLFVSYTSTETTGEAATTLGTITASPASASTAGYTGVNATALSSNNNMGGTLTGQRSVSTYSGSNASAIAQGMFTTARNNGAGSMDMLRAIRAQSDNDSSGITSRAYGVWGGITNTAGGTITSAYGVYSTITNDSGNIGNAYGVYVNDISTLPGNKWAVFTEGTTPSYFGGSVGIGTTSTTDASAILQLNTTTKGLRLPNLTTTQVNAVTTPAEGLLVYDVDTDTVKLRANGAWVNVAASGGVGVGDVNGPASATDNAIARYDGTTGKIIQNSAVTISDLGETTITSTSAAALAVGANGATNPVLQVNANTASVATGVQITGAAAAAGVDIAALSSGANEGISLSSKGTGSLSFRQGTSTRLSMGTNQITFTSAGSSAAALPRFRYTGAAETTLTASTEAMSAFFDMGQIRQHATGALALQRDFRITPSTHSFAAASTLTTAASFAIDGAPLGGTNATITNSTAIYVPSSAVTGTTNAYGMIVNAPTGGTAINYAADFGGKVTTNSMIMKLVSGAAAPAGTSNLWSGDGTDLWRTTGNVGIGTNNPTARLYVKGTQSAYATDKPTMISRAVLNLAPHASDTTNLSVASIGTGNGLGLQVSNSNGTANWDLILNPFGGNVGIGTATANSPLQVEGGALNYTGTTPSFSSYAANVGTTGSANVGIGRHNSQPAIQGMGTGTSYGLYLNPAAGNVIIANGGGNVGIGTGATAPEAKLHVKTGNIQIGDQAGTLYSTMDWNTLTFHRDGNFAYVSNAGTGGLSFGTNGGINKMVIDADGDVGMGGITAPNDALHVNGAGLFGGTALTVAAASVAPGIVVSNAGYIYVKRAGVGAQTMISFLNNAAVTPTVVGSIATSGSATTYNTASDRRLKENVVDTGKGLDTLMRIEVKDFNFIADQNKDRVQGFIAQQLYTVYPEAVTKGDDGATVKDMWAVDYGRITPLIIKAIQDIKGILDDVVGKVAQLFDIVGKLQAENAELKAQNADILKRLEALEAKQ